MPYIHKIWIQMKTKTKSNTSCLAGYINFGIHKRQLNICDKYKNLLGRPICSS